MNTITFNIPETKPFKIIETKPCSNCNREIEFIMINEVYQDYDIHCIIKDKKTQDILSYIYTTAKMKEIIATCLCSQNITFLLTEDDIAKRKKIDERTNLKDNMSYFYDHFEELIQNSDLKEKYVAISQSKIIASALTFEEVFDKVLKIDTAYPPYIAKLTRKKETVFM